MPTPPSQLPKGAIPRPEGRILVFKIPPVPEAHLDQLNGHMVSVRLEASVKVCVCVCGGGVTCVCSVYVCWGYGECVYCMGKS